MIVEATLILKNSPAVVVGAGKYCVRVDVSLQEVSFQDILVP